MSDWSRVAAVWRLLWARSDAQAKIYRERALAALPVDSPLRGEYQQKLNSVSQRLAAGICAQFRGSRAPVHAISKLLRSVRAVLRSYPRAFNIVLLIC